MFSVSADAELDTVAEDIRQRDRDGLRTAGVLRATLDQLYDGQRTGRYRWDQLLKTEKTHCGTLVEINLHREFQFEDGVKLDFRMGGIEVDCKYSQRQGGWMIPPEAQGHLCLLLWAEDSVSARWSMGLVRITTELLNMGENRDHKATLNKMGRESIYWIFKEALLPPNVLLQLDEGVIKRIFSKKHGQPRVNELFRSALGMRISSTAVATVGQQKDYMRRIRAGGGVRNLLRKEGIIVLGQYLNHRAVAQDLGVSEPGPGESVPVRLAPALAMTSGVVDIGGRLWRIARSTDPVVEAPELPDIKKLK